MALAGRSLSTEETFRDIYRRHHWSEATRHPARVRVSDQTPELRTGFQALLSELGVATLLDLPCGDYGWMRDLRAAAWTGTSAPTSCRKWSSPSPPAFGDDRHDSGSSISRAIPCRPRISSSAATAWCTCRNAGHPARPREHAEEWHPLPAHHDLPHGEANEDIVTGDWRVIDLERAPFHLPAPMRILERRLHRRATESLRRQEPRALANAGSRVGADAGWLSGWLGRRPARFRGLASGATRARRVALVRRRLGLPLGRRTHDSCDPLGPTRAVFPGPVEDAHRPSRRAQISRGPP